MEIETKYLGRMEIDRSQIIEFPKGLPGFEEHKEFVLIDIEETGFFKFLQDINNPYLAFILVNPWDFYKDYDIVLPDDKLLKIGIDNNSRESLVVYNIVTMGESLEDSTCNLLAPIVINIENMKGKQFILNDSSYQTKHDLFDKGDLHAHTK